MTLKQKLWLFFFFGVCFFYLGLKLSYAGDNAVKLCRGGADHGEICTVDGNCPADSGGAAGICTILGHPRYCSFKRYCAVSTNIPCDDNWDCDQAHGGGYPWITPTDVCTLPNNKSYPNTGQAVTCTTDSDCRICTAGTQKGNACTSTGANTSECGTGGTCGSAGSGTCLNGVQQSQITNVWNQYGGKTNDLVPDAIIGSRTMEDAPVSNYTSTSYFAPSGVAYDATTGDLWVADTSRVVKITGIAGANQAASTVLGQADFAGIMDERLPGEISQDSLALGTRRSLGWSYTHKVKVFHGIAEGIWVAGRYKVRRYPLAAVTFDENIAPFIGPGASADSGSFLFTDHSAIALMDRCTGGDNIGQPCTAVSQAADCPGSGGGTCGTTLAVSVYGNSGGYILVWRDVSNAADGSSPDFTLGGPTNGYNGCNTGGLSATSLCGPKGIDFDPATGDLWVADSLNNRVVAYHAGMGQNATAYKVIGQADFTHNSPGVTAATMQIPSDLDINDDTGELIISDTYNNRLLYYSALPTTGSSAEAFPGQPDGVSAGTGQSSDGTKCNRLFHPYGVSWANSAVWVTDGGGGDGGNRRVFKFNTPAITNSGDAAAAAWLQGQADCATVLPPVDAAHFSSYPSGFATTSGGALIISDFGYNRLQVWLNGGTAHVGEPNADRIVGQANGTSAKANRGGSIAANTLNAPAGVAFSPGSTSALAGTWVADYGNNRIGRYNGAVPTNDDSMDFVIGQSGFTTGTCNAFGFSSSTNGAKSLCGPRGITVAQSAGQGGNVWVADYWNHRVLMYCMDEGTMGTSTGFICDPSNSGDAIADLVLGQPNFTSIGSGCSSPGRNTMCNPVDVAVDISNQFDVRVFVMDQGPSGQDGRIMLFQPGNNWANGLNADVVLGALPGAGNEYTTYSTTQNVSSGQCEALGTPTGQICNFEVPDGYPGNSHFCWNGGSITGYGCTTLNSSSGCPGGSTCSDQCVGGSNVNAICSIDATCTGGGSCGCPTTGGVFGTCLHRRSVGAAPGIDYDAARQILYVARSGGVAQMYPPFVNNAPFVRQGGKGTPHGFNLTSGDFTENYQGGIPFYNTLGLDTSVNRLYSAKGDSYGSTGVWVINDPVNPTNTATVTKTRTATNTPVNTATPTSTPTATDTPTGTLPDTPTITPTPTSTPTFTVTLTVTKTVTPTVTDTPGGPTATNTPIPSTSTPTPVLGHSMPLNAGGFFAPSDSTCFRPTPSAGADQFQYVMSCAPGPASVFYIEAHVVPSMTKNVSFQGFAHMDMASGVSCWVISNSADVVGDQGLADGVNQALGLPYGNTKAVSFNHISPPSSDTNLINGPVSMGLFNAKTGFSCASDSDCDNSTLYYKVQRIDFGSCDSTHNVDWTQVVLSWP